MTTQQFFKGLLMAIIAVVVAAFNTVPIDYLLLAVTAFCAALAYAGKNLIPWLHSDSPAGTMSFINMVSALLVALGTGILQAAGLFLIDGAIDWPTLGKVVLSVTFTYLGGTYFAPPYTTEKKRVFANRNYIRSMGKGAAVAAFLLVLPLTAAHSQDQGAFKGFFKPKAGIEIGDLTRAEGDQTRSLYVRPAAQLTAIQFNWNPEEKQFTPSQFSSAGIGLGIQNYVEHDGKVINNYGANLLIVLDASQGTAGIGGAITVNALQFVNLGGGYSITNKQWFLLTGAGYNF
jgi:hypothetical protein